MADFLAHAFPAQHYTVFKQCIHCYYRYCIYNNHLSVRKYVHNVCVCLCMSAHILMMQCLYPVCQSVLNQTLYTSTPHTARYNININDISNVSTNTTNDEQQNSASCVRPLRIRWEHMWTVNWSKSVNRKEKNTSNIRTGTHVQRRME